MCDGRHGKMKEKVVARLNVTPGSHGQVKSPRMKEIRCTFISPFLPLQVVCRKVRVNRINKKNSLTRAFGRNESDDNLCGRKSGGQGRDDAGTSEREKTGTFLVCQRSGQVTETETETQDLEQCYARLLRSPSSDRRFIAPLPAMAKAGGAASLASLRCTEEVRG